MMMDISIHALLAESDVSFMLYDTSSLIFLSTLSLRRATSFSTSIVSVIAFLSTLSLRRATCLSIFRQALASYFYPRSPCGERQRIKAPKVTRHINFYPRSPCGERLYACQHGRQASNISIHALLAESD